MSVDDRGNFHLPAGLPGAGRFTKQPHTPPESGLRRENFSLLDPDVVRSRRALIDVVAALSEHQEALTVVGAHAVIEMTQDIPDAPPADTTRDGDLGVTPSLLLPLPRLTEVMESLGYERSYRERPGTWSPVSQAHLPIHSRDTIDLLAPYAVSFEEGTRPPRRGARVGDHGNQSVSATRGTELTVVDRELTELRSFDEGSGTPAYVAGASALLCAKAYKLHDRMDAKELTRNAARLRPKDFADVYRLILSIEPEDAFDVFAQGMETARIGEAVAVGRDHLVEVFNDESYVAAQVADVWQNVAREAEFEAFVAEWRGRFVDASR